MRVYRHQKSLHWKLTLGRKSLAALGNQTFVSGVTVWCSNQLSYTPSPRLWKITALSAYSIFIWIPGQQHVVKKRNNVTYFICIQCQCVQVQILCVACQNWVDHITSSLKHHSSVSASQYFTVTTSCEVELSVWLNICKQMYASTSLCTHTTHTHHAHTQTPPPTHTHTHIYI